MHLHAHLKIQDFFVRAKPLAACCQLSFWPPTLHRVQNEQGTICAHFGTKQTSPTASRMLQK